MALIEISGVHKWYGEHEVLKGIDLNVDLHEVVCLIGASGSGKSTLLRCVNALEDIEKGSIRLDGDLVSGPGVDVNRLRRRVGIVFQSYNLFPHMTVQKNIELGSVHSAGMDREQAATIAYDLLVRVGLADKASKYPDQSLVDSSSGSPSCVRSQCSQRPSCWTRSPRPSTRNWSPRSSTW
jgi:polar amino acid transport system ATP-binding protein